MIEEITMDMIPIEDGQLRFQENYIPAEESDELLRHLLAELAWREEDIMIAGRRVRAPRLVCWYGDPDARYRYSGIIHEPLLWLPILSTLKSRIQTTCGRPFNSVLANLYRDGHDSMGWHADQEKELGINPEIASLSFGATRLFRLRHNRTGQMLELPLNHGSLLWMGGSLQHHWRHCVPKCRGITTARVNLTYRTILQTV